MTVLTRRRALQALSALPAASIAGAMPRLARAAEMDCAFHSSAEER